MRITSGTHKTPGRRCDQTASLVAWDRARLQYQKLVDACYVRRCGDIRRHAGLCWNMCVHDAIPTPPFIDLVGQPTNLLAANSSFWMRSSSHCRYMCGHDAHSGPLLPLFQALLATIAFVCSVEPHNEDDGDAPDDQSEPIYILDLKFKTVRAYLWTAPPPSSRSSSRTLSSAVTARLPVGNTLQTMLRNRRERAPVLPT
jgi:hypothetical protein